MLSPVQGGAAVEAVTTLSEAAVAHLVRDVDAVLDVGSGAGMVVVGTDNAWLVTALVGREA